MKRALGVSFALLLVVVCSLCFGAANYDPQKEIVIPYTEFNGRQVELVYDGNFKSITLRVRLASFPPPNKSPEQEFLKNEVIRIKESKQIQLGNSGYELLYKGGYPSWSPMAISDPPSECLTFATGSLSDKTITARGEKKKPAHYPYEP
jgi:hypothetical protein